MLNTGVYSVSHPEGVWKFQAPRNDRLFAKDPNAADRKRDRDREHAFPFLARRVDVIDESIFPFALLPDVKGFAGFERRIHEIPDRTARFQHGTMTRVLWQERTLRFTARPQADARACRIRVKAHLHGVYRTTNARRRVRPCEVRGVRGLPAEAHQREGGCGVRGKLDQ
jgi:hypothetical protein